MSFDTRKFFEEIYLGKNSLTARRNEIGDYVLPSIQDAYAGFCIGMELAYIEGQKAMREMAANKSEVHICDNNCSDRGNGTCCEFVIAESIRALPIEGD